MNIILLSGGSGKRLWPLSNNIRSKQFLKILKREDGTPESMVQRMYRMIMDVDSKASITIATSDSQVASIKSQLGDCVNISVEPCRRDTFPAIALAVAYLKDELKVNDDEPVVVCPVDSYVEKNYFETLEKLNKAVKEEVAKLVLMGNEPTYPSEKYGYIIPTTADEVARVHSFKEKPDESTAENYIEQGALWNSGVFAFKLSYVLKKVEEQFGFSSYDDLFRNYEKLERISFDYAVVEKEKSTAVLRYFGSWKDMGTWNTLTEAMSDAVSGNATAAECENVHIINELQVPLIALGVKDLAIAATPDGILVTDKESSTHLKDYVGENRPMTEKRIWGEYEVLDIRGEQGRSSLTKHLLIKAGEHISYQRHQNRSEVWTVIEGTGMVVIDGVVRDVERGDVVSIACGRKHGIKAITDLHIIEVQIGDELTEEDIERIHYGWK